MKSLFKSGYNVLIKSIGALLEQGKKHAFAAVNPILVRTYWSIGEQIVKYEHSAEEDAGYGGKLFERIAKDLKARYGAGFSRSNIIYMRLFYKKYPISQTVSDRLSWSHYVELLDVDEDSARQFYEKQCIHENWSVRELKRQFRMTLDDTHYYVDLVFYHRILKCFVLIDLKAGKVTPQDIGQMNMYLNYFKSEESSEEDSEPIGIILSAKKNNILVRYALGSITNRLFVSKYALYLPDKAELENKLKDLVEND